MTDGNRVDRGRPSGDQTGYFQWRGRGKSAGCFLFFIFCFYALGVLCRAPGLRDFVFGPTGHSVFAEEFQRVCCQGVCFRVEIADTPEKQRKGLMFRDSMPDDHGMLFVFHHESVYPFWMKNTRIPLDMIWLDSDFRVAYIEHAVPPCQEDPCPSYSPNAAARYVLELNAGISRRLNLKPGDWCERVP